MADFRVAIGLLDDTQVVYTAANGRPYQSEIVLDELTKELVERFNYWVGNEDTQYERPDLELLGRILYHILFPTGDASGRPTENLRELFEADYAQFFEQAKGEDRFHLTLELHE